MPIARIECPKNIQSHNDLAGWKVAHAKQGCDEMWDRSSGVSTKTEKKCVLRWAVNVRAQYEPAKRAIRVFRWHHRPQTGNAAARLFYEVAGKWKNETMHWSSVTKMIAHPSYLRIVGLGRDFKRGEIESLLLQELEREPDHWFEALAAITGENPVGTNDDFDAAVNAWLTWGRERGFLRQ